MLKITESHLFVLRTSSPPAIDSNFRDLFSKISCPEFLSCSLSTANCNYIFINRHKVACI